MIRFILNHQIIETDLPRGTTVLDYVRYVKNLKGTKIGCREGDCGACTILIGELAGENVKYRAQTSCLMPLANAAGKHVVTIEGINRADGEPTPVQAAMIEQSGTQCGFCTVGFVVSLTGFCLAEIEKTTASAVSAIDGNICRCTGYKSIERACAAIARGANGLENAIAEKIVPAYFAGIKERLREISDSKFQISNPKPEIPNPKFVGGGTDLYVQKPEEMTGAETENLFDSSALRFIEETEKHLEIGASAVVTDLIESAVFRRVFPRFYRHLKLVSSTPIRNMATLAGNFVNASPIGDMTIWFLALDASIVFNTGREIALRDFYLGYKKLAKAPDEFITRIRFRKDFTLFNFEKVCKRTYLDIASVNSAISLRVGDAASADAGLIAQAHVSIGGVFATPLYLKKTSEFLNGKEIGKTTVSEAAAILQDEISPISDVRGSAEYKRLLARQLFKAHFVELFGADKI